MVALLILGAFIAFPQSAAAFYYDPGFGSIVTQMVFVTWLSGVVVIGKVWKRIVKLFATVLNRPASS